MYVLSSPSISSSVQSGLAGTAVSPDNEKPGLLNRNCYVLVIPNSAATYRLMWSNEPLHLCCFNAYHEAPILLSVYSKVCFPPSCVCMCLLNVAMTTVLRELPTCKVPDAKFQEVKLDYLVQVIVITEMTAKKIKAMKVNKPPGVDGISPKLLMETVEQITIPLARMFNLSLKEGVVRFHWKEAYIVPLFKNGSRNTSDSYRPESLTSVIYKLLEMIIKCHLVDFLVWENILNPYQHGFLKTRSCLTNMLFFGRNR